MVKITHPSMRRGRDTSMQNSPQTYIVEDETGDTNQELEQDYSYDEELPVEPNLDDIDARLKQFEAGNSPAPTAVSASAPSKSSVPKKTLESLLFAGRIERDFEIAGNTYSLTTLTNKEHTSVVKELYNFGEAADLLVIKSLTLALSLKRINNIDLGDVEVDGVFDSEMYRRKEIIDSLQQAVVEKLYSNYSAMVEESEKLVSGEELKKS